MSKYSFYCSNVRCRKSITIQIPAKKTAQRAIVACPACKHKNKINMEGLVVDDDTMDKTQVDGASGSKAVGWIVVHDEHTNTQTYALQLGKNTIGRKANKPANVLIETADKYMSRNHCVIEAVQGRDQSYKFVLYDIGSTNGTYVNAKVRSRLGTSDEVYIKDGDTIQIGRTKVVLKTTATTRTAYDAEKTVLGTDLNETIIS